MWGAVSRRDQRTARAEVDDPRAVVDDLGYVFIVTYARSGSTLLQGILNSIPGYLVRGENLGVVEHLYRFHTVAAAKRRSNRRRRRRQGVTGPSGPSTPFFGIEDFAVRRSLDHARAMVIDTLLRPEPDTRVAGFKEIRYNLEDLLDYVDWMREVFPGARFVVNTRDLDAVARSKIWSDLENPLEILVESEQRLMLLLDHLGDAAFRVRYDDYIADPSRLRALFAWLGEPFDLPTIEAVLAVPHSY